MIDVEAVYCFVCNLEIKKGQGRFIHGEWVLCVDCHEKRRDELPPKSA